MELNKSRYIHLAIMLIIVFGMAALPPFGKVTPFGMKALGVFIAVLYGWIFFDLFWTSLFGFMMIPIMGLNTVAGAFGSALSNQMMIIVLLSFGFAVAVDMAGVTEVMANWLLQRKLFSYRHFSDWRNHWLCRSWYGGNLPVVGNYIENCRFLRNQKRRPIVKFYDYDDSCIYYDCKLCASI